MSLTKRLIQIHLLQKHRLTKKKFLDHVPNTSDTFYVHLHVGQNVEQLIFQLVSNSQYLHQG